MLAQRSNRDDAAIYLGHSPRGLDSYSIESARMPGLRYLVTYQLVGADHSWHCECPQGAMRKPCSHVGAALLLAGHRAEVIEALAAAADAQLTWSHAEHQGAGANGCLFYLVASSVYRAWDMVLVTWDPRHGRDVAVRCACGEIACPHIGAVALRREQDKRQQEWARRSGRATDGTPWAL